jgi:hypothetical protein
MFSDLVGSTALSGRMDPEDLREVISAYQKCVAETVQRFGGFVAKYMGDGESDAPICVASLPPSLFGVCFARLVCDRLSFKQDLFLLRRRQSDAGLVAETFNCDDCGFEAGRDVNAALNSTGRKFCGDRLWRSSLWRGSQQPRETRLDEAGRKDCCSGGGLMLTEISSYFRTVHPFRLESLSLPQKMPQKLHRIDPHQGPLRPRPVRSIRCKAGETA